MPHFDAGPSRKVLSAGILLACATPAASAARGSLPFPQSDAPDAPLEVHPGEPLDPSLYGPGVIETMEIAMERERRRIAEEGDQPPSREPMPGVWAVPSRRAISTPHSGALHAFNEHGDLSMGIGFGEPVDLVGVWLGGQADRGAWPPAVRAVGYRDGVEAGATEWFEELGAEPRWLAIGLEKIDRVVFEAQPAVGDRAWYTLDDLTFARRVGGAEGVPAQVRTVVLDFEDTDYRQKLSGSGYAGLDWEVGVGLGASEGVHAPQRPPGSASDVTDLGPSPFPLPLGGSGTTPDLVSEFEAIKRHDHGSSTYPPDTCGSVGPDHFVVAINRVFAVYDKDTGVKLQGMNLGSFLPGSNGDPRVHYDPHSGRWFVTVTDFSTRIYIAVSLTSDPTGAWFKSNFNISQGSDTGCWPDYPTMGVDANGVYIGAYMVGCGSMSLFAVDKAPLIQATPSLGTITAFRNLDFEGALQPCLTYGDPGGEFVVSTSGFSSIRVRRVSPPMTNPTLATVATINVGSHPDPPNAPALGSVVNINTVDDRLMNAVYRDGSIWCAHNVSQSGKVACRWYELGTAPYSELQSGTITDGTLHFYYPGITVNANGDVGIGFSGSHSGQYVGAYFSGRLSTDPPNEMGPPVQFRAGAAPQNNIDGAGRNRWGDYSLSGVDPEDELTFWTIQEYAHSTDVWGTHVAEVKYPGGPVCPDPTTYCVTSPNSVGSGMTISFTGSTSISAEDMTLVALAGPPSRPGIFFYGPAQTQVPFGNGFLCIGSGGIGTFRLPVIQTDAFGDAVYTVDFDIPPVCCGNGAFVSGDEWNFQFWYRDPDDGGANFNLSDALNLVLCE